MSNENGDTHFDKLHALPAPSLDPAKRITTLRAAEDAFGPPKKQAKLVWRWPEFALVSVLALGGMLYTAESMAKIGMIYGHAVAATGDVR